MRKAVSIDLFYNWGRLMDIWPEIHAFSLVGEAKLRETVAAMDPVQPWDNPKQIRLPGVCIDCRAAVVWNGKRWLEAPVGRGVGRAHNCASERAA